MPETAAVRFAVADVSEPSVLALIDLHLEGMRSASPPESVHALDRSGLTAHDIELHVGLEGREAVVMGAMRRLPDGVVELKSMRVRPDRLGRGLGRAMLEHLLELARRGGAGRVSLETGSGEVFEPALRLYRSRGFRDGPAFGGYQATAFNQFLHLDLPPEGSSA